MTVYLCLIFNNTNVYRSLVLSSYSTWVEILKVVFRQHVALAQEDGMLGIGDCQVVSVLAFYSDHPSSNPTEACNFSVKLCLKITKINKKRPGLAHLKKSRLHV